MATRKMSKYIFSVLLLLAGMHALAQNDDRHAVSLGIDLSRFAVPFTDSTRYGWEVSGDYEIIKDLFGCVEVGSQTTRFDAPLYHYTSNGAYTRIGVDYNYMKHVDDVSTDQLLIGIRYGFTTFYHEADNITVVDNIWGNYTNGAIGRTWLSANWLEVVTGMRGRIFNNFYLGWTARFRVKLGFQDDPQMQPYYIPGYGRAWNNSWVGFNYSLYYKIPLMKKRSVKEAEQLEKETN